MAGEERRTRIDVLEQELRAVGMEAVEAESFAHELVLEHPYARRFGVHTLAAEIATRGVDIGAAIAAATTLLSIELLGQGRDFDHLHRELRSLGFDSSDATASALDGARVWRQIQSLHEPAPSWVGLPTAIAMACLAGGALLWQVLG